MNDNDRLWLAGVCRMAGLPEDAWMTKQPQRKPAPGTALRDLLLLVVGVLGILYEVLLVDPRPALISLFALMIGLPYWLHFDRELT